MQRNPPPDPHVDRLKVPQSLSVWLIQHKCKPTCAHVSVCECVCCRTWPTMEAVAALINQAECSAGYKHSFSSGHKNVWHQKKCQASQFFCPCVCMKERKKYIARAHLCSLCNTSVLSSLLLLLHVTVYSSCPKCGSSS